jgi:hypothetical protein
MTTGDVKLTPDKTWIPIGVALGGIASLVVGAVWISSSLQSLQFSNENLAGAVSRVETSIDRVVQDGISRRELQQWIEVARARNPTLILPDVIR